MVGCGAERAVRLETLCGWRRCHYIERYVSAVWSFQLDRQSRASIGMRIVVSHHLNLESSLLKLAARLLQFWTPPVRETHARTPRN